jgi:hypothetical protein
LASISSPAPRLHGPLRRHSPEYVMPGAPASGTRGPTVRRRAPTTG